MRYFESFVSQNGEVDFLEAALLPVCHDPGPVAELGVGGAAEHFAVVVAELLHAVTECDDLSGTHESEIARVEKQDEIFAVVVLVGDFYKLVVEISGRSEIRRRFPHLGNHLHHLSSLNSVRRRFKQNKVLQSFRFH